MFLLASESPRRRELLEQIGAVFEVRASHVTEFQDDAILPDDLAMMNAKAKAMAIANAHPGIPVLAADTVVAMNRQVYGKPVSEEHAKEMLAAFSGKKHTVITAIAIVAPDKKIFSEIVTTDVQFAEMTEDEIADYVAGGEPMDKAGGYAIQGRAALFIERINGSYSNVVGLPLQQTAMLARKAGVDLYGNNHAEGSTGR